MTYEFVYEVLRSDQPCLSVEQLNKYADIGTEFIQSIPDPVFGQWLIVLKHRRVGMTDLRS